jgi:ElaA protein
MSTIPEFKIKPFKELSVGELYQLLRLRSEVFVVEQNCIYQDIDGKDYKALHLIGTYEDTIVAYARLFDSGDYFENASVGRVIIAANFRDRKWGHELIKAAIKGIETHFNATKITISAQSHLKNFYESNGFMQTSDIYLEDGIPHIEMLRN